jgi:hypothetical protein
VWTSPATLCRAAGLEVLARGEIALTATERRAEGWRTEVPSKWLVAGGVGCDCGHPGAEVFHRRGGGLVCAGDFA